MITITCTEMVEVQKIDQLFVAIHTRAQWVKPAQPVKPKYLTPAFLMKALSSHAGEAGLSAPINSRLNVVVRSPAPFGLGRNGCWPCRGSQLPRALPIYFFAMLPPERPQKGSTQHL